MFALNENPLNTIPVNGDIDDPVLTASGNIIPIAQTIGIVGSGNLIPIVQTIELRITGSGNIIPIVQEVQVAGSGNIIQISQNVVVPTATPSKLQQYGWDVSALVIGSETISSSRVTNQILFNATEDGSPQLDITIKMPAGVVDVEAFQGKSIFLNVITEDYGNHRLFTGKIDIPEINLILDEITLRCSSNRLDLLNAQSDGFVNAIGFYSSEIFQEAPNKADELNQRLETVPQSLEVTNYGQLILSNWAPTSTAHFTFSNSNVYREKPVYRVGSNTRIINQVNIDFEYRYDINYHMQRTFQWTSPIDSQPCLFLVQGYDLTKRSIVRAAADSSGWPIRGEINFGDIPSSGLYRCGAGLVPILWSTSSQQVDTVPVLDSSGDPVTDVNGNPVTSSNTRRVIDFNQIYCASASWTATTRWAQTINELYSLTVQSATSIAKHGVKSKQESHGVESTFDSSEWENYTAYENLGLGTTYFIKRDTNLTDYNNAVSVALNRAKTTIVGSHRDSRVEFTVKFFPGVQTYHTVATSAPLIVSKGKVFSVEHILDVETGLAETTIKTSISSITSSGSDSVLSSPTRPTYNPTISGGSVFLGNHFGQDPTTEAAKSWNGFIGNKFLGAFGQGTFKTEYQISFVVDTPPIEDSLRDTTSVSASQTYNVSIPKDTLTITLDDKA